MTPPPTQPERLTVRDIAKLTRAQKDVLTQVALNNDAAHSRRVLEALVGKGLIEMHLEDIGGHPPMKIRRYTVPIPVHIVWAAWASTQRSYQP